MKRQRLIWFAGGAATSAVVTICASLFQSERETKVAFLTLEEPWETSSEPAESDKKDDNLNFIANRTGELLRSCGAQRFETMPLAPDFMPHAYLPLTSENAASFDCVLKSATRQGFSMNLEMRTDRNAQTH